MFLAETRRAIGWRGGLGVDSRAFAALAARATPEEVTASNFAAALATIKDLQDQLTNKTYATLRDYRVVMQNNGPAGLDQANQTITYPNKMEGYAAATQVLAQNGGIPSNWTSTRVYPYDGATVHNSIDWVAQVINFSQPRLAALQITAATAAQTAAVNAQNAANAAAQTAAQAQAQAAAAAATASTIAASQAAAAAQSQAVQAQAAAAAAQAVADDAAARASAAQALIAQHKKSTWIVVGVIAVVVAATAVGVGVYLHHRKAKS